jgi:TadE-like protein
VVELTIILPIVLLLIFGIIEFGKAFNYWIDMTHLANEGSRYASVNRWPGCPVDLTQDCPAPSTLQQYIVSQVNTTELDKGVTGGQVPKNEGVGGTGPGGENVKLCYPADTGTPGTLGQPIRITVSSNYRFPIVSGVLKFLSFSPDIADVDLHASSTVRLEQVPTAKRVLAGGAVPAC